MEMGMGVGAILAILCPYFHGDQHCGSRLAISGSPSATQGADAIDVLPGHERHGSVDDLAPASRRWVY
jgi:hypothetical protein